MKRRPATTRLATGLGLLAFASGGLLAAIGCSEADAPRPPGTSSGTPTLQQEPVAKPLQTREDVAEAYATDTAREPVETDWSGGDVARGSALYASHCATCHGAEGRGDGPAAIALNPKPRDFRTGAFSIDADADGETGGPADLARVILHGPGRFGGSEAMVAWKDVMDDRQVRDLVAFVRSLSSSS